jgi:hypothetical protein
VNGVHWALRAAVGLLVALVDQVSLVDLELLHAVLGRELERRVPFELELEAPQVPVAQPAGVQ